MISCTPAAPRLCPVILWALAPPDLFISFTPKKELFALPIFGKILQAANSVKIDRGNASLSIQRLKTALQSSPPRSFVMFPEGTRHRYPEKNTLKPFKKGPFVLAKTANKRLVPLLIQGANRAMPVGSFFPKPATIVITVLDPITPDDYHDKTIAELQQHTQHVMQQALDRQELPS